MGESLIVSGQPAESRSPGEASLDHPAPGQQDETTLCLGVFDHLQLDAVPGGRALGGFSGVTLVDVAQLHLVSGDPLHLFGELFHLGAVLLVGGCDIQSKQVAQSVNGWSLR